MKSGMLAILAVTCLVGCGKSSPTAADQPATRAAGPPGMAQGGNEVNPIGPAAGPITPVTGGDNIQSTPGGGGAQWMKTKARSTAATPPATPDEDDSGQ